MRNPPRKGSATHGPRSVGGYTYRGSCCTLRSPRTVGYESEDVVVALHHHRIAAWVTPIYVPNSPPPTSLIMEENDDGWRMVLAMNGIIIQHAAPHTHTRTRVSCSMMHVCKVIQSLGRKGKSCPLFALVGGSEVFTTDSQLQQFSQLFSLEDQMRLEQSINSSMLSITHITCLRRAL